MDNKKYANIKKGVQRVVGTVVLSVLVTGIFPSVMTYAQSAIKANRKNTYVIGVDEKGKLDYGKITPSKYIWKSTNSRIVGVNKKGKVAGKAIGVAYIKGYNRKNELIGKYRVKVVSAPKAVNLSTTKIAEFPNHKIDLAPSVDKGAVCNNYKYKCNNEKVAVVDKNGVVTTKSPGKAVIRVSTYNGVDQRVQIQVKDPKMAVAITFDDGPVAANTEKVLNVLQKNDYHATFFMVGENVKSNASLLKRMVNEGHQLGTHTYGHINMTRQPSYSVESNVKKTMKLIKEACGQNPTVLRPPYGATNGTVSSLCKQLGLPIVMWNVDTEDWKAGNKSNARVKNLVLSMTKPGKIVLLHDLHKTSAQGFVDAVPELKRRGYELVTVEELAELHGDKLEAGKIIYGY